MGQDNKKSLFSNKIKQIFITGILASLPLIVTIYLLLFIYHFLISDILPIISKIFAKYDIHLSNYILQLTALITVIVSIFLIGVIARAYIGNKLFKLIEKIMSSIPIARTIYYGTKQVIDSFKSTSGSSFSKVVLVEFPRRDMWMIGFVVKDSQKTISNKLFGSREAYNVFVPTAPNPTSGYISIVPKDEVKEINISVEEGIKFVLSIGLVNFNEKDIDYIEENILRNSSKDVY